MCAYVGDKNPATITKRQLLFTYTYVYVRTFRFWLMHTHTQHTHAHTYVHNINDVPTRLLALNMCVCMFATAKVSCKWSKVSENYLIILHLILSSWNIWISLLCVCSIALLSFSAFWLILQTFVPFVYIPFIHHTRLPSRSHVHKCTAVFRSLSSLSHLPLAFIGLTKRKLQMKP